MNKDNIFTMTSAHDVPVDSTMMADIERADEVLEVRSLIRMLIRECYGWPVEKEEHLYGVKASMKSDNKDPKNSSLKLPKGRNSRDKA